MEQVVMEISATMQGAGGLGQGKLRVTTERLVFERKKMFGGAGDVATFPLSTIQSAGISGILEKKLKVQAGSKELVFSSALGNTNSDADLKSISNLLQRSIAGHPLGSPVQAPAATPDTAKPTATDATSWLVELERLAKLHAVGALDDDEFASAKRKLLDA